MTATATQADATALETETCKLDIGGMTCASCVGRVEKALHKLDGVAEARVNLATEVASVTFSPELIKLEDLTGAITKAGYTATPAPEQRTRQRPPENGETAAAPASSRRGFPGTWELARMKTKWQVALATGLGLMALMYVPLYIDTMDLLMPAIFVVATVVQIWAGKDIYISAWTAAKHRSTNMTTLVALGTGVACGYSTYVTRGRPRREVGHAAARVLRDVAGHRRPGPGREADRGPRQEAHRRAVTALVGLARKTARSSATGAVDVPSTRSSSATWCACRPGGKVPINDIVTKGATAVDESMLAGEGPQSTRGPAIR